MQEVHVADSLHEHVTLPVFSIQIKSVTIFTANPVIYTSVVL